MWCWTRLCSQNRTLYFCFSEPARPGNWQQHGAGACQAERRHARLEDVKVHFRQKPKVQPAAPISAAASSKRCKNGQPDGTLFLTLGDRFSRMQDAQKLDNHHGKVVRMGKDGSVPQRQPLRRHSTGAMPEIWSYGHRNSQGAALAPDGTLWTHEHGPQGGDEINLPRAGNNYGWPVISYGENYGGGKIGDGITAKAGMEQPLHYWVPSIAPSGMAFVTSRHLRQRLAGNLLVGSLKFGYLNRIEC